MAMNNKPKSSSKKKTDLQQWDWGMTGASSEFLKDYKKNSPSKTISKKDGEDANSSTAHTEKSVSDFYMDADHTKQEQDYDKRIMAWKLYILSQSNLVFQSDTMRVLLKRRLQVSDDDYDEIQAHWTDEFARLVNNSLDTTNDPALEQLYKKCAKQFYQTVQKIADSKEQIAEEPDERHPPERSRSKVQKLLSSVTGSSHHHHHRKQSSTNPPTAPSARFGSLREEIVYAATTAFMSGMTSF